MGRYSRSLHHFIYISFQLTESQNMISNKHSIYSDPTVILTCLMDSAVPMVKGRIITQS